MMSSGVIQLIVDNGQLPVGWEIKKLGEVCTLQRGFDLPKEQREEGDYLLISSSGCIDTHTEAKVLSPGVVTGRSGSIGSVFFITEDFWPLNTTLYVRDFHGNDPRFIFYLLNKFDLKRFASGVGVPTLNRNNVHSELIIIPSSITEQRRIVAILDEAFEGCDRAIRNTENNLANARELFESYLNAIFTQKGDGWVEKKLDEIAGKVFTGPFGSLLHKSDYISDGIPIVNPANIEGDKIIPNFNKTISQDIAIRMSAYILKHNDVVVGRRGEIGRCAVVREDQAGWLCGSGSFFIKPFENVNSIFLAHLLRSLPYRSKLEKLASGATMLNLSNQALSELILAMPSLDEQNQITSKLDDLRIETQRLEIIYRQKIAALKELKQSILQKAFTGELTAATASPSNRNGREKP